MSTPRESRARGCRGPPADFLSRRHRPLDPSVRRGSLPRVHAVAGRDGESLAEGKRAGRGLEHVCERNRRRGNGITVLVVLVAKFVEGAWITALLIPALLILRSPSGVISKGSRKNCSATLPYLSGAVFSLPARPVQRGVGMPVEKALRFALTISTDIEAVHVPSVFTPGRLESFCRRPGGKTGIARAEIGHPALALPLRGFAHRGLRPRPPRTSARDAGLPL